MVYDNCIIPINRRSEWPHTDFEPLLPQLIGKQTGKPSNAQKKKKKEPDEQIQKQKKRVRGRSIINPTKAKRNRVSLKCSKYHQTSHNKRGYKYQMPEQFTDLNDRTFS